MENQKIRIHTYIILFDQSIVSVPSCVQRNLASSTIMNLLTSVSSGNVSTIWRPTRRYLVNDQCPKQVPPSSLISMVMWWACLGRQVDSSFQPPLYRLVVLYLLFFTFLCTEKKIFKLTDQIYTQHFPSSRVLLDLQKKKNSKTRLGNSILCDLCLSYNNIC